MSFHFLLSFFNFFLLIAFLQSKRVSVELTRHKLNEDRAYVLSGTYYVTNSTITLDLINTYDLMYTGYVSIGTPAQDFVVVFDTGSADLWVFASNNTCTAYSTCVNTTYDSCYLSTCCYFASLGSSFNSSKSLSYNPYTVNSSWFIEYGSGNVSGHKATDIVQLGGMTINDQVFALATYWSLGMIGCGENQSGILGFAMRAATSDRANTVLENMYTQGLIDQKIFSVSLKNLTESSVLIIGEPDSQYYRGNIVYSTVMEPADIGMWFTLMEGVLRTSPPSHNLTKNTATWVSTCLYVPCIALLDTGTSYLLMPPNKYIEFATLLTEITSSINSTDYCRYNNHTYNFICPTNLINKLPTLWFQMNGYALPVYSSSYFLYNCGEGINYACLAISESFELEGYEYYILGDVFLREYYVIFDESNSRIGFGSMDTISVQALSRNPYEPTSAPSPSSSSTSVVQYVEYAAIAFAGVLVVTLLILGFLKWRKRPSTNQKEQIFDE